MEQSGKWNPDEVLTLEKLKELFVRRFALIDYKNAKADVFPFLSTREKQGLEYWNKDFFTEITKEYLKQL